MPILNIKPLSVNQAFKGRRFKTAKYSKWVNDALYLLPSKIDVPEGKLSIEITFAFSSKASDLDNGVKQFLDLLTKKYEINDNRYYRIVLTKEIVKKGNEFIEFKITKE